MGHNQDKVGHNQDIVGYNQDKVEYNQDKVEHDQKNFLYGRGGGVRGINKTRNRGTIVLNI